MSKTIGTPLLAHFGEEVTTLATCWKVTTTTETPAVIMGFTDHVEDLDISSVLYRAATGSSPMTMRSNDTLAVNNSEMMGWLSSTAISEDDLRRGRFDGAEIEVFMVNYESLGQGAVTLIKGWLGEVTLKDGQYTAELRSLAQALQQTVGEVYSVACRADLGDSRCSPAGEVDLTGTGPYLVTGAVISFTDNRTFVDTARTEADLYFNGGKLTWTSGNNMNYSMEVKNYDLTAKQIILVEQMYYDIQVGDTYEVYPGCDKAIATCKDKFNNVVNFRGEPFIPGTDAVIAPTIQKVDGGTTYV